MSADIAESMGKLIPLADAARIAGLPLKTFRRRMYKLNHISDGRLLLPRGDGQEKRRFLVDAEVLRWLVKNAPIEAEHDLESLRLDVADLKKELAAEKRKRSAFEARVRRWIFGGREATRGHERPQADLL